MSYGQMVQMDYYNPFNVWVLLKSEAGLERAVPPGETVRFLLPVESEFSILPLHDKSMESLFLL